MFDNIGSKIKTLAKVFCWVGIVVSIILSIIMFVSVEDAKYSEEGLYRGLGFAFLFLGPLASWISSFLLYGFGELIETNCEIAKNTRYSAVNSQTHTDSRTKQSTNSTSHTWIGDCDFCNKRDVKVSSIKIVDNMGTRYKNVCEECAKNNNCISDREKKLDDLLKNGLISQEEYDKKKRGE